uniref:Predicted protein n=1 Tax=Hordeum vulgare subsp. vulgare TaxID=112509 RepID=F2D8A9_HORVV|nr:predicted protein [Hordeum vulgare subsp. vulgare]
MASSVGINGYSAVTRVLFCGHYWPASTIYTKEYLQKYPFIQVDEVGLEHVPDVIQNYHICVVKNKCIDSDIIAKATKMKIIMQYGVGLEEGNECCCHSEGLGPSSWRNNIRENNTYPGVWSHRHGNCQETKTIWSENSCYKKKLVIKYSVLCADLDGLVDKKGGPEDMYELAREADIVITCMTLNNESVGIVNHKFLSTLKKGSYLINIARGRLLDYTAVFNHLESGHLGGLGIDVAWTEPFDPEDPILKFPNVIITPHIAGITEYSYRTMAKVVGDVALKLHAGEPFNEIEFVN